MRYINIKSNRGLILRSIRFIKLTKNWRSHPVILKFPSDEFYNGELEACADPTITHSLRSYHKLSRKDKPIIFHGICGRDMRQASSPSYFNKEEASLVKEYVKNLLDEKGLRLSTRNNTFFLSHPLLIV